MDAAAELGRNPVSKQQSLNMEMNRLTWDGNAEPVSRHPPVKGKKCQNV